MKADMEIVLVLAVESAANYRMTQADRQKMLAFCEQVDESKYGEDDCMPALVRELDRYMAPTPPQAVGWQRVGPTQPACKRFVVKGDDREAGDGGMWVVRPRRHLDGENWAEWCKRWGVTHFYPLEGEPS